MYNEEFDHVATMGEAVTEWACNVGMDRPDRAWLLHDYDVWVRNPAYRGPDVPHPESAGDDYLEAEWEAAHPMLADACFMAHAIAVCDPFQYARSVDPDDSLPF